MYILPPCMQEPIRRDANRKSEERYFTSSYKHENVHIRYTITENILDFTIYNIYLRGELLKFKKIGFKEQIYMVNEC